MKFNLINLQDQIRDEKSALKFLQDRDVIKSSSLCATCNAVCSTQTCSTSNYVHFYCTKCRIKESVRKDTFLYNKVNFIALIENVLCTLLNKRLFLLRCTAAFTVQSSLLQYGIL